MNERLTDIELLGLHQALAEIERATKEAVELGELADPQIVNLARTYAAAILEEDKYESFWPWANEIEDLSRLHCPKLPAPETLPPLKAIVDALCRLAPQTCQ